MDAVPWPRVALDYGVGPEFLPACGLSLGLWWPWLCVEKPVGISWKILPLLRLVRLRVVLLWQYWHDWLGLAALIVVRLRALVSCVLEGEAQQLSLAHVEVGKSGLRHAARLLELDVTLDRLGQLISDAFHQRVRDAFELVRRASRRPCSD